MKRPAVAEPCVFAGDMAGPLVEPAKPLIARIFGIKGTLDDEVEAAVTGEPDVLEGEGQSAREGVDVLVGYGGEGLTVGVEARGVVEVIGGEKGRGEQDEKEKER